jgi:hypothetical protein
VLAIGYLLVRFLCLWCHIVEGVVCRFLGLVVEATVGVGLTIVAEVEVVLCGGWVAIVLA